MEELRSGQIQDRGTVDRFADVRCDTKRSIKDDFKFLARHMHW